MANTRRSKYMRRVTTLPFATTEDRGTEPTVAQGILLTAADVIVNQEGRSEKRTGLASKTGTFTEPGIACAPGDQPVLIGEEAQLGVSAEAETGFGAAFYSDADDNTAPDIGHHAYPTTIDGSFRHCPTFVDRFENPYHVDCAVLSDGNIAVAASYWGYGSIAVLDQTTGAQLLSYDVTSANWNNSETPFIQLVTSANGDTWYLFIDPDTGAGLDVHGGTVTSSAIGAHASIYSTYLAPAPSTVNWSFQRIDCCAVDGDNIVIAYICNDAGTKKVAIVQIDASDGTTTSSALWHPGDHDPRSVGVFRSTTNIVNVLCYDMDNGVSNADVWMIGYTLAGGTLVIDSSNWPETRVMTKAWATNPGICYGVTGVALNATNVMLYATVGWHSGYAPSPAYRDDDNWQRRSIRTVKVTAGAPPTVTGEHYLAYNTGQILTKPILDASGYPVFMVVHYPRVVSDTTASYIGPEIRTQLGSTFLVKHITENYNTADRLVTIGKVALGRTYFPTTAPGNSIVDWDDWGQVASNNQDRCPSHMVLTSTDNYVAAVPMRGKTEHGRRKGWDKYARDYSNEINTESGGGVMLARVDLAPSPPRTHRVGHLLSVGGSVPLLYDGDNFFENGDLIYPEDFTVGETGAGVITGDIGFAVVPLFTDDNGNAHFGTPVYTEIWSSLDAASVEFCIATNPLTRKKNTKYLCYRTKDAGRTYYFLGEIADTGSEIMYESFTTADANLGGPGLYTELEIENSQPPNAGPSALWQNREFFVDKDEPSWLIRYSKKLQDGKAPAHNEIFQLHCPADGGDITAMEPMGDQLFIFKERRIYSTFGEGLAASGAGSNYAEPRLLSDGVGCTNEKTICKTPMGIMFVSEAGIHLLQRGGGIAWIGKPMQYYTDTQSFSCAVADPDRRLAVFIPSAAAGKALVYHWAYGIWTTWSGYAGTDAALIGNELWIKSLDQANTVVREDRTAYVDYQVNAITPAWETGWISANGLAGFVRLNELRLLGYNVGDHTLTVQIAYDYAPDWIDTITYDSSALENFDYDANYGTMSADLNEEEYVLRFRGSRTKFSAIRFRFTIS